MRKIYSLLLLIGATMMAWTGAYAQTDAEYEAALAAIQDNGVYYVKSDVGGTDYYLKGDGTLTQTLTDAAKFIFQKTAGSKYGFGFKLNNNGTFFSNPSSGSYANDSITDTKLSTSTRGDAAWESQVFFLNTTEGKYAVRACNCEDTGGWSHVGSSFWTVNIGDAVTAGYSFTPNYCWELEIDATATEQYGASLTVQSWPFFMQSAVGLVKDASKFTSNAKESSEGSYEALLDNVYTSYFHSAYSSNIGGAAHYLQAELSQATQKFEFYFKKRSHNNNNRPTTIVISASNDGTNFDEITTLDEGLPTDASVIDYLSGVIDLGASYKYVRFTVTATNNGATNGGGEQFFTFSEFYIFPGVDAAAQVAVAYNQFASMPWQSLTTAQVQQIKTYDRALKAAISTVNVTYELYEADGTTLVKSQTVVQQPGSEVVVPTSLISDTKFYDYSIEDTNVGMTNCTIKIIRTLKPGFVGKLADLSNNKAYTITCDRGKFLTKDGYLASTAHSSLTSAEAGQFAIISYEDNYYLYSVADGKFVTNDGSLADSPTNKLEDAIVMDPKSVPYFLWHFNAANKVINTNGNNPYGYVINNYSSPDPGNQYYMFAEADFDPTNAIKALNDQFHPQYFVTYKVKDAFGNTIFTSDPEPAEQGTVVTTLPQKYRRTFYTYNEVNVTVETTGGTDAEFTATWNGPFEISENFANAHWYNMTIRRTWYVTSDNKDADGALKTVNANAYGLGNPPYHWAFIGDGYNGFKLINKAQGADKVYAWTSNANASIPAFVDAATGNVWEIKASTASGYTNAFMLTIPGDGYQVNQFGGAGGSLKIWNATGTTDDGSAFNIMEIPTDFGEFVSSEIAPYFEGKYFILNDEVKATVGYDPAYKTECPYETYKSMKDKLAAINMKDLSNFILPETGYYILKNKNYNTFMGIDPSDANMYGNYAAADNAKHIVKLIKTGDATYQISLMGKFAPATVSQSTQVTASTEAGTYTVSVPAAGYAAFQADPESNMSALHCAGGGSIVGWEPASAASMWALEDAKSINLTVGEAGYATAYLPFPAKCSGVFSVEIPEAKGTWTFEDGTTGSLTATAGVTVADGVATVPAGDNLSLTHGIADHGTYTFMMDVKILNENPNNGFTSLFMSGPASEREDGGLFFNYKKKNDTRTLGIQIGGMGYGGSYELDTWYRVVFSCNNYLPTVYVNGEKVVAATQVINPTRLHWTLSDVIYFFADNDGEENDVQTSEIRLWDVALTADEVAMLQGPGYVPQPKESDLKAYTARITDTFLTLDEVSGTIPYATPVILKATPETYVFSVEADAAAIEGNDLKGTFEPIDAAGKYILAKPEGEEIGFYEATTGSIAAGKAYLEYNGAADIKGFIFKEDGATGIANVEKATENGPIYNIAGQRLSKVQKGINIVNGKKVLY